MEEASHRDEDAMTLMKYTKIDDAKVKVWYYTALHTVVVPLIRNSPLTLDQFNTMNCLQSTKYNIIYKS